MKLLLTSAGLTTPQIAAALFDLVGKPPHETNLVYIPTAMHMETGDKGWVINNLANLQKQGFKQIDIADISAVPLTVWKPKLDSADVLFFEGGNQFHLMEWIVRSGLDKLLPEYLKTKVYVGLSAGSMVACPTLQLESSQKLFQEDLHRTQDMGGLNLVDFNFLPHLNSFYFPLLTKENIQKIHTSPTRKIYVLDDHCAIKIHDKELKVVGTGQWFSHN